MNLVIDIGNTAVKCAVFDNKEMCGIKTSARLSKNLICNIQKTYPDIQNAIISNVRRDDVFAKYLSIVKKQIDNTITRSPRLKIPLRNMYDVPHSLGSDRIAAAVGAWDIFQCQNILIISVGTAITFDLVTQRGEFIGGRISLGLKSRYKALHSFTGKLPLCKPASIIPDFGTNTIDAITSGVQNGILYEICGTIEHFVQLFPHLQVILTGGDAIFFTNHLPNVLHVPNITLIGLNIILNYQ